MKRLLLLLSAFAAAIVLHAAPVSEQRVREVVLAFMPGNADWEHLSEAPEGLHIFNRKGGGFIIISADDCALPVLAYSYGGRFTLRDAPDNLRAWADATSRVIRQVVSAGKNPDSRLLAVWDAPSVLSRAGAGTHLINTATWGQGSPFNYYAPTVDGEKSIAGCVAVSMAIIMRHYGWPKAGSGILPAYTYMTAKGNTRTQSGHALGDNYKWSDMPLNHVPEDNRSVAKLVYDCGVAVQSSFNAGGTSAFPSDAPGMMAAYFSYSLAGLMEQRAYYSTAAWFDRLKAEIDADHPVLYSAYSSNNGHAFVVDGYDDSSRLHVNWGWKGECNGYFSVDCFFPYSGDPSKEAEYGYYYQHAAAFDLVPDKNGSSRPRTLLCLRRSGDYEGMRLSSGSIGKGTPFTLDFGLCTNRGLTDYQDGALRIGLVDRTGALREFVGDPLGIMTLEPNYGTIVQDYTCRITLEPALGDVLRVFYRVGQDWLPMSYSLDDGTVGFLSAGPDVYFISEEGQYIEGQRWQPEVVYGQRPYLKLQWYLDGVPFEQETPALSSGRHTVKAVLTYADGSKETIVRELEVP